MGSATLVIRPAARKDLPTIGRLGAHLMRLHHGFDPQRFMAPRGNPEDGYAWFLGTQLDKDDMAVIVAELGDEVLGYVFIGIEPQSWKELRDEAGYVHDLVVDERGRRQGIGTALMAAALDWMRARRLPRVVLWTAQPNGAAQHLFDRLGFRKTMIEMTKEL
jgi:ribosomal protein S18 acetylase RimI-like enzyme